MQTSAGRKRLGVTPVACDFCRRQKTKCDGVRPICGRCYRRGCTEPCQYDKVQSVRMLQKEVSKLQAELSRAKDISDPTLAPSQSPSLTGHETHETGVRPEHPLQAPWKDDAQQGCHLRQHPTHEGLIDTPTSLLELHPSMRSAANHDTEAATDDVDTKRRASEPYVNSGSIVNVLGENSLRGAITCNHYPDIYQGTQLSNTNLPVHLSSTLWLEPDTIPGPDVSWVNKAFWDMRSRGRWLAKNGLDIAAIMGDTCPTISPFAFPEDSDDGASFWTVSRWASRFVDQFPNLSHADRLACWVVIFVTFQWQICPNAETYRNIPDWYRPLPIQNFVPHMPCLDILIWPSARSYLAEHPQDFIKAVMSSISVSWPYGDSSLYCTDLLTGKRVIVQSFISWCLDMSHWSVAESSLDSIPQLKGKIKTR